MKAKGLVFVFAIALISGGAGLLLYLKAHQRLGKPAVLVAAVPLYDEKGKKIADQSVVLPETVPGATSKLAPVTIERNALPEDTTLGKRIYHFEDGFEVMSSVVLMGNDRTSLHKPEICILVQGWNIDSTEIEQVKINQPVPYELPVTKLKTSLRTKDKNGEQKILYGVFVYWFVADKQMTARHEDRMIWMAKNMLRTGVLDRWAYISCFALSQPGQEQLVFERIKNFMADSVPQFQLVPASEKTNSPALAAQR
jgi:hypothetical protein